MNLPLFDTRFFSAINRLAGKSSFLDNAAVYSARFSMAIFSVILLIYFFKNRRIFWMALSSAILSRVAITGFIRFLVNRPRPYESLPGVNFLDSGNLLFSDRYIGSSFPSGHAAFLFAVAFAVYLFHKKIGAILILLALLLTAARVYIGVHYPLDILGGIGVAALSVYLVHKLAMKLKK